ncbi:hypothetical protein K432DRAFT_78879 [Lepidopterella palustris CBS 459.81]|uniref:Uncharacterized protein n=1 Tax=Lepidopterella palustris CBS 459.81 TaxID=1314670 RepID=A0A8E2E807_9PEZI|nr:hypothetical protein K432DRAFT_78879 [Lepidopterella palustris CBS 459.81]
MPPKTGRAHKVKEEDLTYTRWDNASYEELRNTCRERDIPSKDSKKAMMAKALAADDETKEKASNKEIAEARERKVLEAKEKKRKEQESARRAEQERRKRKELGEGEGDAEEDGIDEDSADKGAADEGGEGSDDDQEYGTVMEGKVMEKDDSLQDTTKESTTRDTASSYSPQFHYQKIRIYSWPYPDLPSPSKPKTPTTPRRSRVEPLQIEQDILPETVPVKMKYSVWPLATTKTKEEVVTPGWNYPFFIKGDWVPKLYQGTIEAARNGALIKQLRHTKIESGKDWSKRTYVQWWNGRIFLEDVSNTPSKSASKRKASTSSSSSRQMFKSRSPSKETPNFTRNQRNKISMALDIHSLTSGKLNPFVYLPAYLDYDHEEYDSSVLPRTLDGLYFITSKDEDLPYFYFWTRPGEWQDPTQLNPEWKSVKDTDEKLAGIEEYDRAAAALLRRASRSRREKQSRMVDKLFGDVSDSDEDSYDATRPVPLSQSKIRVRKTELIPKPGEATEVLDLNLRRYSYAENPELERAICSAERLLNKGGLKCALDWLKKDGPKYGHGGHCELLTEKLPFIYPSGKLPAAPPVHEDGAILPKSVAWKIASLKHPNPDELVSPLRGDEPWTRNDDEYWIVVDRDKNKDEAVTVDTQEGLAAVPELDFLSQVGAKRKQTSSSSPTMFRPPKHERMDGEEYHLNDGGPVHSGGAETLQRGFDDHADIDGLFAIPDSVSFLDGYSGSASGLLPPSQRARAKPFHEAQSARSHICGDQSGFGRTNRHADRRASGLLTRKFQMPVHDVRWQLYALTKESMKHELFCRVCLEPVDCIDQGQIHKHYEQHRRGTHCQELEPGGQSYMPTSIPQPSVPSPSVLRRALGSVGLGASGPKRKSARMQKKGAGLGVKATFSPNTLEKIVAYNDKVDDRGAADEDYDSPVSPAKSNIKSKTTTATRAARIPKCLNLATIRDPPGRMVTRSTTRSTRKPKQTDSTYEASPTSSPGTPSPVLRVIKRKPANHLDARFTIRKASLEKADLSTSPAVTSMKGKRKNVKSTKRTKSTKKTRHADAAYESSPTRTLSISKKRNKPNDEAFKADKIIFDGSSSDSTSPTKKRPRTSKKTAKETSISRATVNGIFRKAAKPPVKPKLVALSKKMAKSPKKSRGNNAAPKSALHEDELLTPPMTNVSGVRKTSIALLVPPNTPALRGSRRMSYVPGLQPELNMDILKERIREVKQARSKGL